jgi:phosphate-selective porin OprO/OprP
MIRKHFAGFTASALALAVSAQAFAGTVTTDGPDLVVKTKGGLEVATTDKAFSFKLGGRLQADYSSFDGFYTKNGNSADAAYFRRAFLELGGVMYTDWKYQVNYDFSENAGSSSNGHFDEAAITYTGFKPVEIKMGRFDPIFGLEKATSSKAVTAPERNAAYDLIGFAQGHEDGLGLKLSAGNEMLLGDIGYYAKDSNDEDGDSLKQLSLRGVIAPMAKPGEVLHFGLNYAKRDVDGYAIGDTKSRLGIRGVSTSGGNDAGSNGNRLTLINKYAADSVEDDSAWGLEAAFAAGAYSIQAEYLVRDLAGKDTVEDVEASGWYVQNAYTLTGEPRDYKLGAFGGIKPADKSIGAWEIFHRYDYLESDDKTVSNGGLLNTGDVEGKVHNLGVNWYPNDLIKLTAAYVTSDVENAQNDNGDDDGSGFVVRAQYAF